MKMKEVCQQTGLTEKAVRLYIKQGLVTPQVEEGLHTNSYTFSEKDVAQLQDVAALRGAGFSMADIRQMQQNPDEIPALLEEKQSLLTAELRRKQAVQAALERLQVGDRGDTRQIARTLRQTRHAGEDTPIPGFKTAAAVLVLGIAILLMGWYYFSYAGVYAEFVPIFFGLLSALTGAFSLGMAMRYAGAPRRAARMPARGTARVLDVVKDTSMDGRAARSGAELTGVRDPGIGGDWQFVWMLWNELRPDHWFPVLRYEADGQTRSGTFPYGGLRNTWREEETIEIAWDPARPEEIYPLRAPWLTRKALAYGVLGLALLAVGLLAMKTGVAALLAIGAAQGGQ